MSGLTRTRRALGVIYFLIFLLLPLQVWAQETMCVTKSDFREAVHAECRDARAAADRYATCRDLLAKAHANASECAGKISVLDNERAMRVLAERLHERAIVERYSVWTVATVGAVGVAVGVLVGFLASQ